MRSAFLSARMSASCEAKRKRGSIGLEGNAADVLPELVRRARLEGRPARHRVKKGGAETVNIAAKIFRLII